MSIQTESTFSTEFNWQAILVETEKVIRQHSKTFFFATSLLPGQSRHAIRALYAFCRTTDDLVDRQGACLADLEAWRACVNLPFEDQENPALKAWAAARQQYGVNRRYEQELINGVGMDLQRHTYRTWAELENYCYHVASTVGLLSIPIVGLAPGATFEQTVPYATQLGIALQLTNILRDVGEDLQHERIYLPVEDLQRFSLTIEDIRRRVMDARFTSLMRFEIQRARQLYQQSLPGIALLHATVRPAVGAAALLYQAILDEIEEMDYQVFERRAHTSGWKKLSMLPGILYTVCRLKAPQTIHRWNVDEPMKDFGNS